MEIRKKAIVTIALGENYYRHWKIYCEANWKKYADKYSYDLICFSSPLESSERAQKRSPSWQKCLILTDEICKKYERVVWLDADILVNHETAPDIIEQTPVEKIGGINARFFYAEGLFPTLHRQYINLWKHLAIPFVEDRIGRDFYQNYGICTHLNEVIQAGVLILSPQHHKELLERVYYHYENRGGAHWNYEMRPLSYEIVKSGQYCFIDGRFNFLFHHYLAAFHPDLFFRMMGLPKAKIRWELLQRFKDHLELKRAMKSAFSKSFFLHFAGCPRREFLWGQALRLTHAP